MLEVYEVADEGPLNPVRVGYILLEKLSAESMEWFDANQMQKETFTRQLADIYIELAKHPFPQLGCLMQNNSNPPLTEVGPAFFACDSGGRLIPSGPC